MAYRQEEAVPEIVVDSGVLTGRNTWYPGREAPDHVKLPYPEFSAGILD